MWSTGCNARVTQRQSALKLFLIWSYNKWEKITIDFSEAPKGSRYKVFAVKARSSKLPSCTGVHFQQMTWISCHRPAQLVSLSSYNSLRNMQMWTAFSRRWSPLQMLMWFLRGSFHSFYYSLFPNSGFPLPPRSRWPAPTCQLIPGDARQAPPAGQYLLTRLWPFPLIGQEGPHFTSWVSKLLHLLFSN